MTAVALGSRLWWLGVVLGVGLLVIVTVSWLGFTWLVVTVLLGAMLHLWRDPPVAAVIAARVGIELTCLIPTCRYGSARSRRRSSRRRARRAAGPPS